MLESTCLSVCPHVLTRLLVDGLSCNFILETFIKKSVRRKSKLCFRTTKDLSISMNNCVSFYLLQYEIFCTSRTLYCTAWSTLLRVHGNTQEFDIVNSVMYRSNTERRNRCVFMAAFVSFALFTVT